MPSKCQSLMGKCYIFLHMGSPALQTDSRTGVVSWGRGDGEFLMSVELQFHRVGEFWRQVLVTVAQKYVCNTTELYT